LTNASNASEEQAAQERNEGSGWLTKASGRTIVAKTLGWIVALFLVVGLPSVLSAVSGFNPAIVFQNLVGGAIGSADSLILSLDKSTAIVFASLGAAVAFRGKIWNIGIQGQILMGALGSTLVGLYVGGVPRSLHLVIAAVAGMAMAGLWGLVPGLLREKLGVNVLVSSLLLNYVAYWFVSYLVRYPLLGKDAYGPTTDTIKESAFLPGVWSHGIANYLKVSFLLSLLVALVLWYVFKRTTFGFRVAATGANTFASRLGGVPVSRTVVALMVLSGAVAGLAGFSEISGTHHYLTENIAVNYGFYGIAAALIGRGHLLGVAVMGIVIGSLFTGGLYIQATLGVPATLVTVIVACFLIGVLVQPTVERRLHRVLAKGTPTLTETV
jgi:simple sugar transport system permease protein